MKRRLSIVVAVAGLLAASAGTAAAPAATTVDPGRIVQLLNQVSGVVRGDQSNCRKMGSEMKAFLAAHNREFAAFHRQSARWTAAQKLAYARRWGAQIHTAIRSIATGVVSCAVNGDVRAALTALSAVRPH